MKFHMWKYLCIASGGKGVTEQSPYGADVWEKIQGGTETKEFSKWKLNVYLSEFLQRIYQTYRHCMNTDTEDPENIRIINMTFIKQSILEIKKKIQKLGDVFQKSNS